MVHHLAVGEDYLAAYWIPIIQNAQPPVFAAEIFRIIEVMEIINDISVCQCHQLPPEIILFYLGRYPKSLDIEQAEERKIRRLEKRMPGSLVKPEFAPVCNQAIEKHSFEAPDS